MSGLFQSQGPRKHREAILRGLNLAAVLCEDRCVIPPHFRLECDIVRSVVHRQRAFMREGLFVWPIREDNLGDFLDKKRREFAAMRHRYEGLFDDKQFKFLADDESGVIRRDVRIGEAIATQWQRGPDTRGRIWKPLKARFGAPLLDEIRLIPSKLVSDGSAITFGAMRPLLPTASEPGFGELHRTLLHVYFKLYMKEFNLVVLRNVPLMHEEFDLPSPEKIYDVSWFAPALRIFGLYDALSLASAELILLLRRQSGFTSFIDAYAELCPISESRRTLTFHLDRAKNRVKFDWDALSKRIAVFNSRGDRLSEVEAHELADALGDVARELKAEHGIPGRTAHIDQLRGGKRISKLAAPLTIFVALDEELDVLAHQLGLSKSETSPAAHGVISGVPVDVLCPRAMGRVPAAIEVARYLEKRRTPPKLIIVAGLAGGISESGIKPGHIIFGTRAVDLAHRKITDDKEGDGGKIKTQFRREDFRLSDALWKVQSSDLFHEGLWLGKVLTDANWPKGLRPVFERGLIASVDEVVSSDPWRAELLEATPKLLAIEMESGGVCAAAEKYGVPVAVVRAVSDQADPSKADDIWRQRGMITIASLLASLPLERALALHK